MPTHSHYVQQTACPSSMQNQMQWTSSFPSDIIIATSQKLLSLEIDERTTKAKSSSPTPHGRQRNEAYHKAMIRSVL